MDWKILLTVFAVVFIAELGDKTQIATLLFATDQQVSKWLVFAGASLALICASALGVVAGGALSHVLNPKVLGTIAGAGFMVIGAFTLIKSW